MAHENSTICQSPAQRYQQRLTKLCDKLEKDPGLPTPNPTVSYWQEPPADLSSKQSASLPQTTDVAIIGSGITGCSVAKQLLESNDTTTVTVFDARNVCSGATGRNGGHIKAVPELSYAELEPSVGHERAKEVVDFTLDNVTTLLSMAKKFSPELQEHSEVRAVDSLNLFTTKDSFDYFIAAREAFESNIPERQGRGRLLNAEDLRKDHGVSHAIGGFIAQAGAAWPYRMITGIFAQLLDQYSERVNLEAQTPVESIELTESGTYQIKTSRGAIQAKTIVHATNGHAGHLLPGIRGRLWPMRGQMSSQSSTDVAARYGGKRSWSITYDHGFDYITQSGRSGEIFYGGGLAQGYERGLAELGNTHDDESSILAASHLGGAMNATFGIGKDTAMTAGMKATWTGVMGFTTDGVPLVGRLPQSATGRGGENEWISAGYNGYGMPNAWLCGKHIADQILESSDGQWIPKAYEISEERLQSMRTEDGATYWLSTLGLD